MDKLEDKSNNQIITEIQQIKLEHEALKNKILRDYEKLEYLEKKFNDANKIISLRLRGNL